MFNLVRCTNNTRAILQYGKAQFIDCSRSAGKYYRSCVLNLKIEVMCKYSAKSHTEFVVFFWIARSVYRRVTGWRAEESGFNSRQSKRCLSPPQRPGQIRAPIPTGTAGYFIIRARLFTCIATYTGWLVGFSCRSRETVFLASKLPRMLKDSSSYQLWVNLCSCYL
jgi:hypothetical protein